MDGQRSRSAGNIIEFVGSQKEQAEQQLSHSADRVEITRLGARQGWLSNENVTIMLQIIIETTNMLVIA